MTFKETIDWLQKNSQELRMNAGDDIVDEMAILRTTAIEYLTDDRDPDEWMSVCSMLFKSTCKHACSISGKKLEELYDKMEDTYHRKNADYGNSWEEELDMFGIICMNIRSYEKLNRVISVSKNGALVNESLLDTLCDIAIYCVITGMFIFKNYYNG